MPTPRSGETREEFMGRCIPQLVNEGKEQDQAVAICSSIWENKSAKTLGQYLRALIDLMFGRKRQ